MTEEKINEATAKIISRAWSDPEFKARLIGDPSAGFAEAGIPIPHGVELRVVEDTAEVRHFVLSERPDDPELADETLEKISAGAVAWVSITP